MSGAPYVGLYLSPIPKKAPSRAKNQSGGVRGFLRLIKQQQLPFSIVLASIAIGLVPVLNLLFLAFAIIYTLILSRTVFTSPKNPGRLREIFRASFLFEAYMVLGKVLGLVLPLIYEIGELARGDGHGSSSAISQMFLLSCEILSENIISHYSIFLPPMRALIPSLCIMMRFIVILYWNYDMWTNKTVPVVAPTKDVVWFWVGRGLSGANLVYFLVKLFGFLIPQLISRSFDFEERGETHAKIAEDKTATVRKFNKMKALFGAAPAFCSVPGKRTNDGACHLISRLPDLCSSRRADFTVRKVEMPPSPNRVLSLYSAFVVAFLAFLNYTGSLLERKTGRKKKME